MGIGVRGTNTGVMFIVRPNFTLRTAAHRMEPEWPRIGDPRFKRNTFFEGDRKYWNDKGIWV